MNRQLRPATETSWVVSYGGKTMADGRHFKNRYIAISHADPLFYSLNLLKLTHIGQIQTLTFMYKYHHGVLPTTFVNYFCKVADVHSYLTRQSTSLHITYARTNQRKNTENIGPKLWNKQSIRDSPSLKIFKSRIHTEIVNSYLSQYHS